MLTTILAKPKIQNPINPGPKSKPGKTAIPVPSPGTESFGIVCRMFLTGKLPHLSALGFLVHERNHMLWVYGRKDTSGGSWAKTCFCHGPKYTIILYGSFEIEGYPILGPYNKDPSI